MYILLALKHQFKKEFHNSFSLSSLMKIHNTKNCYFLSMQPADYEPPFFRGCTEEEAHNPWTKNPLKMEVGKVNSKHLVLALKVKDEGGRND